jgi:hypothetical protein
MKKALIGMAAGAMALGASVVPASAGFYSPGYNLWDAINDGTCNLPAAPAYPAPNEEVFEQLVLTSGWAERFDTDGNGDARYTVFAPIDGVLEGLLENVLELEVSELNSQPALVASLLADHIANGSFDENELEDSDLTRITMRSGFVATVFGTGDPIGGTRTVGGAGSNVFVGGSLILGGSQVNNGWLYCLGGVINSTPQVAHEGLNSQDTPNDGTPGGTNSLPDTL